MVSISSWRILSLRPKHDTNFGLIVRENPTVTSSYNMLDHVFSLQDIHKMAIPPSSELWTIIHNNSTRIWYLPKWTKSINWDNISQCRTWYFSKCLTHLVQNTTEALQSILVTLVIRLSPPILAPRLPRKHVPQQIEPGNRDWAIRVHVMGRYFIFTINHCHHCHRKLSSRNRSRCLRCKYSHSYTVIRH